MAFTARGASATRSNWRHRRYHIDARDCQNRCTTDFTTDLNAPEGRVPRRIIGSSVPRRSWHDPDVENFLRRGIPVVVTNCPLISHLVGRWSFDYLAEHYGGYDQLAVHFAPLEETQFSRHYGSGMGKGGVTTMSFARFAELAKAQHLSPAPGQRTAPLRYYLQTPVVWNDADHRGPHGLSPESEGRPLSKAPFGPGIEDDMKRIDWRWLRRAQDLTGAVPFDTCQMWAGHGGGESPQPSTHAAHTHTAIPGVVQPCPGARSCPRSPLPLLSRL